MRAAVNISLGTFRYPAGPADLGFHLRRGISPRPCSNGGRRGCRRQSVTPQGRVVQRIGERDQCVQHRPLPRLCFASLLDPADAGPYKRSRDCHWLVIDLVSGITAGLKQATGQQRSRGGRSGACDCHPERSQRLTCWLAVEFAAVGQFRRRGRGRDHGQAKIAVASRCVKPAKLLASLLDRQPDRPEH